jgi:hypothetical protein
MHVRIDAAGEGQLPFGIEHLVGIFGMDFRREPRHLAVLDADVETVHPGLVRSDDAGVLDDQIERFHLRLLTFLNNGDRTDSACSL